MALLIFSASIWYNENLDLLMGEAQTPHYYDFGIFEPVTKPQNQHYLSLETPGYLKQIKKNPGTFSKHIMFVNRGIKQFGNCRKSTYRFMGGLLIISFFIIMWR